MITFERALCRIAPARIALLRFLVEGYDGLLFLRTVEARQALVELSWAPSCGVEARAVVAALARELGLQPVVAGERI